MYQRDYMQNVYFAELVVNSYKLIQRDFVNKCDFLKKIKHEGPF